MLAVKDVKLGKVILIKIPSASGYSWSSVFNDTKMEVIYISDNKHSCVCKILKPTPLAERHGFLAGMELTYFSKDSLYPFVSVNIGKLKIRDMLL